MSPADTLMLSSIISALLGSTIVPRAVALVLRQSWSNATKRWTAAGVSLCYAVVQWYLTTMLTGQGSWQGLALTGPVVFASATFAYNKYWKGKLGALEEFDLLGKLFGKPDE